MHILGFRYKNQISQIYNSDKSIKYLPSMVDYLIVITIAVKISNDWLIAPYTKDTCDYDMFASCNVMLCDLFNLSSILKGEFVADFAIIFHTIFAPGITSLYHSS